jgi:hypothetical protein
VPAATTEELELMLRMDRALRVAKALGDEATRATNDARFHVGWQHFDYVREELKHRVPGMSEPEKAVVEIQLSAIKKLRRGVGVHSKMASVVMAVKAMIETGEKVILFCHHHATAQELTGHLDRVLPRPTAPASPGPAAWRQAWEAVLEPVGQEHHEDQLRMTFIDWLCADLVRSQTWTWLQARRIPKGRLAQGLRTTVGRNDRGGVPVAEAARALYATLLKSKSSRAVLREAGDNPEHLPGASGSSRVLGVCEPSADGGEGHLFVHNQQPDTIISIFNSPFGPDALVVTDKLSEGIDLHRYCRHLIHYELDPSPIRTVQRNGRLRRVNSWAAVTGQPICYAYPAFPGTRDHRLVQIMKKRIDSFSLLLGGVQSFEVDEIVGVEEQWRNEVVALAKAQLAAAGGQLRAAEPGAAD